LLLGAGPLPVRTLAAGPRILFITGWASCQYELVWELAVEDVPVARSGDSLSAAVDAGGTKLMG
jgi:hypothetical protein